MEDPAVTTVPPEGLPPQYEELLLRASYDALSGLLNRGAMEQTIHQRLEELGPGHPCALFIVDLDDFKKVNDTLGHRAGDEAIRQSAAILASIFRVHDIIGRLGGDEFAVFLSGDGLNERVLLRKAAQICDRVQLSLGDNGTVILTASAGGWMGDSSQSFETMYQAADQALYRAKEAGKHRYCLKSNESYQSGGEEAPRPVAAIPLNILLESMATGVALVEMASQPRLIYVSPSFCRLVGADPGAYSLPLPLSALIHPDDLHGLIQAFQEGVRLGQPAEHTHRIQSADGRRWLWCHIRAVPIPYDRPLPVLLVTASDVSAYKTSQLQLEESNQRLRAAFDQVAQQLWEVDLSTRTLTLYGRGSGSPDQTFRFPDQMVESGLIHPRSAEPFRRFARELFTGQAQGFGNFILRSHTNECFRWTSLSYQMIFDEIGHAVRAVGVAEELRNTFKRLNPYRNPKGVIPEVMLASLAAEMRLDLTQDTILELWIEGKDLTADYQQTSCTQLLRAIKERLCRDNSVNGEDDFPACFSPAQMRVLYREGRRWLSAAYMRADAGGNLRRVRHVLHLTEDGRTHHIQAVACILQMQLPPAWEQAVAGQSGACDPVTRLYTKQSMQHAIQAMVQAGAAPEAAAVFQIMGLAVRPGEDPLPARQARSGIAAALSAALGGSCLLAQYGPDQILALFPQQASREDLHRRFEEAFAFVRLVVNEGTPLGRLRFVAGIALRTEDKTDCDGLISRALYACSLCWNAPVDMAVFAQEKEDHSWTQLQEAGRSDDQVSVGPGEPGRPLSEGEKDVAFSCMSAMLNAGSLEASIHGVLQNLGTYYQADRVYILTLAQDSRVVAMPYEWISPSKYSIQQTVSGMPLSRFPLLGRCVREQAPVFLTRRLAASVQGAGPPDPPGQWHFAAFPLIRGQQVDGFLCIENARQYPADAALSSILIPYVLREPDRFKRSGGISGDVGQLMGMPDLRAYMGAIYSVHSGHYVSLGAVCLDIPGLAAINGTMGFEYGSKMLWYASKSLTDVFGPSMLFRTGEAEFVALLPNTTRQVFLGRCGRLRSILQRRYPRDIRMGCAWADKDFTGKKLVEVARQNMALEPAHALEPPALQLQQTSPTLLTLAGSYQATVYYQPKVDLYTGRLVGAEALVRGIDRSGKVASPSSLLPELEENGGIRELDLFVLNEALRQVDRWRQAGFGVLPVSVNFSRVTLRSGSILASILALQSRYPQLPASALELELTEQADVLQTAQIRELIERFRSYGLRVSLDDFGARYANLSLFTSVSFDTIKLDRSLTIQLPENPISRMLVRDIVQMCQARRMTCLAEGVETPEQIAALLDAGCSYAQGYYYDPPLPAAEFEEKYLRPHGGPSPSDRTQDFTRQEGEKNEQS